MSNSATTAAKRRRATPLLSSPLFQPPSSQSTKHNEPINHMSTKQSTVAGPINRSLSNSSIHNASTNTATVSSQSSLQDPAQKALTLHQVITLIDKRLLHLEAVVAQNNLNKSVAQSVVEKIPVDRDMSAFMRVEDTVSVVKQLIGEHMSEFNHRYEILATEILNLKHIVLKLQSYTLEINKTLMEERIHILSDVGITPNVSEETLSSPLGNVVDVSEKSQIVNATNEIQSEFEIEPSILTNKYAEQDQDHEEDGVNKDALIEHDMLVSNLQSAEELIHKLNSIEIADEN